MSVVFCVASVKRPLNPRLPLTLSVFAFILTIKLGHYVLTTFTGTRLKCIANAVNTLNIFQLTGVWNNFFGYFCELYSEVIEMQ